MLEIHVLLTHLHLDHLEGLRFFAPLWRDEGQVHIWGPPSPVHSLRGAHRQVVLASALPRRPRRHPGEVGSTTCRTSAWELDGIRILALPVSHPGSTVGFRLEHDGSSLAFIPDHEPVLGVELAELEPDWISGHALADGVDVLLHDSQFTERRVRGPRRLGTLERRARRRASRARRTSVASCSSTTTPTAATPRSTGSRSVRPSCGTGTAAPPPVAACEGMTIELG